MGKQRTISAYILCGGTNRRMQTEKGLIVYKDKTFIEWIIEAIKPITDSIFLVTKNKDYDQFGYQLVPDIHHSKGPVGGIYTALKHSEAEINLVLSCDIPNITSNVLKTYLIKNIDKNSDVIYVADENRDYPLIGIYSKKNASEFESAIKNNHLKLLKVLEKVDYECIKVKPEDYKALQNINTKEELQKLIDETQ